MRDFLPPRINNIESAIVNLDSVTGSGTHWVCYIKHGSQVKYFDSFGNLRPPNELQGYFLTSPHFLTVKYNYFSRQKENSDNCGHLCLDFLSVNRNDLCNG